MKSKFTLKITLDSITIFYNGIESLHWIKDEWEEDPELLLTIINIVYLSQRFPKVLLNSGSCHHKQVKKLRLDSL